jgi:hypothetical protein
MTNSCKILVRKLGGKEKVEEGEHVGNIDADLKGNGV